MTADPGPGPDIVVTAPGGETLPEALLLRALRLTLAREGVAAGELSVTFLADEPLRALNRSYLEHDWVPDVLSFGLAAEIATPGPPLLGDVYVGLEQAARQAREHGVPLNEELVRLAVHGTLHLLGYDHPDDAEGRETSDQHRVQEEVVREVFG